jgi:hypothetical protein
MYVVEYYPMLKLHIHNVNVCLTRILESRPTYPAPSDAVLERVVYCILYTVV